MEITYAPKNILQIDNARIVYRNFSGAESLYNRAGDRNFAVIIPSQEMADELSERGWNVTIKPPREEGDQPFVILKVKVKFNRTSPSIYLVTGDNVKTLNEETVGMIDNIDIDHVDLDIRPYIWEMQGKTGQTAYLNSIRVVQKVDRFMSDYQHGTE